MTKQVKNPQVLPDVILVVKYPGAKERVTFFEIRNYAASEILPHWFLKADSPDPVWSYIAYESPGFDDENSNAVNALEESLRLLLDKLKESTTWS